MLTRLREENLAREHMRDLLREAEMEAARANLRRRLAEPVPRPARMGAPWILAAFPSLRRQEKLAFEVSCEC
ncbi:MAG TPA: hypothetical protein VJN88_11430 [Ktedonobacterales bacterium]|nr:hypothetical protein [Ktedonobacterales bacterium]